MASKVISGHHGLASSIVATVSYKGPNNSSVSVTTDASGNHASPALVAGKYQVTCSAPGYVFQSVDVVLDGVNAAPAVNFFSRLVTDKNFTPGNNF
jgi:hypothetical protein